ncbi:succinate dehydrogenase, hydrophobic membrane anchor protein [Yunchengibacter salinarum]|uniref:succinate dehydrogenase, hydrophobic membrane anchor protein n=1 Tax=Yunchengibacter salinarum TaxID=3133399 RepID=UPI0035B64FEC
MAEVETDFKTPAARVHGLGSAKDGTHHFWIQRVTALANIPLTLFMLVSVVLNAGKDYGQWVAWLKQPLVSVLVILFLLNMFHHMRLGLQVPIEDYVHGKGARVVSLVLINFATVLLAAISIFSVLYISFGG